MYTKTKQQLEKVFEVIEKHRKNPVNKFFWEDIVKELNEHFDVSLTKRQWRNQYDEGKSRIKKYGSPTIKLARPKKEIPNLKVPYDKQKAEKKEIDMLKKKENLKNLLIKPKRIEEIESVLKIDTIQAMGLIQMLKIDNFHILYNDYEKTFIIDRKPKMTSQNYKHSIGNVEEFEFMVISDTHWCSKIQQKTFVEWAYKEAYSRGIKKVYHAGDIVDGFYKNRPEHIYELIPGLIGADEQAEYVIHNWPRYPGITTSFILGNHCETHIKNGGTNIGRRLAKERNDFEYLGIGYAKIELTPNCRMDLFHPLDGSSYAVSYSGQKYMDSLSGGDKPNIIFTGHHHKALYFPYRNIYYFEVPSMCQQSSWMKRKRCANESGVWFIKLKIDQEGSIVSVIPEHIKQYRFIENDF